MKAKDRTHNRGGRKPPGSFFLVFFGLPFLAVGVFVLHLSLSWWRLYLASAEWERVEVTIEGVEFNRRRSRSSSGGSSTSYSVDCTYTYQYGGKRYSNTKVGLEGGGSSDSYHRTRYNTLREHHSARTPFLAWVNPADPQQALLFRELTTTMYILPVVGLAFSVVGAGVSVGGFVHGAREKRRRDLLGRYPGQPWKAEGFGDDFRIEAGSVRKIVGAWAGGIGMCAFMSVFVIILANDKNAPLFAKVIVGLFLCIGVGLLGSAVYLTLRQLKYGTPTLLLAQCPLALGQPFKAFLVVNTHVAAKQDIKATLKCVQKVHSRSGRNNSVSYQDVYNDTQTLTRDVLRHKSRGSGIPVDFTLPAGQPERSFGSDDEYRWKLAVKVPTPGIDFAAEFDLPVYHVEDESLIEVRARNTPT